MEVTIYRGEIPCGKLRCEIRGLYTYFYGEIQGDDLAKVTACFQDGTVELGVPVPEEESLRLHRSIPTARLPQGELLKAQFGTFDAWTPWPGGEIRGITYPPGMKKGDRIRIPWQVGGEILPMEPLLLYHYVCVQGESYLELTLDSQGCPCSK